MSTASLRYINYLLDYARQNQQDREQLAVEFDHLQRVWELLTGKVALPIEHQERMAKILNLHLSLDGFLEGSALLRQDIAWIEKAIEAAWSLKQGCMVHLF